MAVILVYYVNQKFYNIISQYPTKEQMLETYLSQRIREYTDAGSHRLLTNVKIIPETSKIEVSLYIGERVYASVVRPTGESSEISLVYLGSFTNDFLSQEQKNEYKESVNEIINLVIKDIEWLKNYEVVVDFL